MQFRAPDAHHETAAASPWVQRFSALIRDGGEVLDFACGSGRHARWLAQHGCRVEAVDRNADALRALSGIERVRVTQADLEAGDWIYAGRQFDAVVVTNYLFRPRFEALLDTVRHGGVLIYETFMHGNAQFGRPSSPDFLLAPGELLQRCMNGWQVVAFEQGIVSVPRPAAIQRICAVRGTDAAMTLP
ncbi:class I SAM-dependent methyltransferase [Azoarcus sp. L1K30]|uniref:class I SAM-dependent methyltransferase n=1 Tax=Azoarcus sp. L1K30 TaxID=2820277 RepID=UPI001B821AFE|nr:class I SAM-dependent methyltransferase [Azoarcus sp. L1K30]MBR0565683.1 class I SAM-dependent methyltransferase [Azoarcus sp. L1K30]